MFHLIIFLFSFWQYVSLASQASQYYSESNLCLGLSKEIVKTGYATILF